MNINTDTTFVRRPTPMMGMNVNRVPAGVPTGGQFAPTNHVEADLQLDQTTTDIDVTADITDITADITDLTTLTDLIAHDLVATDSTVFIDADGDLHLLPGSGTYDHIAQVIDVAETITDGMEVMPTRDAAREIAERAIALQRSIEEHREWLRTRAETT